MFDERSNVPSDNQHPQVYHVPLTLTSCLQPEQYLAITSILSTIPRIPSTLFSKPHPSAPFSLALTDSFSSSFSPISPASADSYSSPRVHSLCLVQVQYLNELCSLNLCCVVMDVLKIKRGSPPYSNTEAHPISCFSLSFNWLNTLCHP